MTRSIPINDFTNHELYLRFIENGDAIAFALLYERLNMPLIMTAIRFTKNKEYAHEVVANYFIKIYTNANKQIENIDDYSFKAVKRNSLGLMNKHQHRKNLLDQKHTIVTNTQGYDKEYVAQELTKLVAKLITEKLPAERGKAVKMRLLEGMPYEEAEKHSGIKRTMITKDVFNIKNYLKRKLKVFGY